MNNKQQIMPSNSDNESFENFSQLAKKLFSVPKSEIQPKQPKQKPTKA
ncbi:MAG: hypothetical protein ACK6CP_08650 [Pseudanabaena sp.]|jgi:hypothetical protein